MLQDFGQKKKLGVDTKAYSPKMVRELLNVDNDQIITLCKKISLVPKRNAKGQTYFSKDEVKILKRLQDLHSQTSAIEKKIKSNVNVKSVAVSNPSTSVASFKSTLNAVTPLSIPGDSNDRLTRTALNSLEKLNSTLNTLETNLSNKLAGILTEKLEGMDEIVVELIRAKTENENLRIKINNLNKDVFGLKNEVSSYKKLGMNLYMKLK